MRLLSGVGRAGDAYEQHADAVADRVVKGENAEDLLDPVGDPFRVARRACPGHPTVWFEIIVESAPEQLADQGGCGRVREIVDAEPEQAVSDVGAVAGRRG